MKLSSLRFAGIIGTVFTFQALQANPELPALDPQEHPASPTYETIFPDKILPVDSRLSWKNRFQGNEQFNADESLPPTSPEIDQFLDKSSNAPNTGASPSGFDTSGVVQQVKADEGKIKIKHETIERLGMPGMTMVFRVDDNDLLAGLEKGSEVEFNVDNSASGFTITRLQQKTGAFDATGIVQQVKAADARVKIKHGPIERLGMPGMTMLFRVDDNQLLSGLEKGSEVEFNVDNTAAGFTITRLRAITAEADDAYDARGIVRSVNQSQGKAKIEHGPIERLGMPGMTMLFKIKDAEALARLERDMEIDFDVNNGPGGFEITRIKPASAGVAQNGMASNPAQVCYRVGPFLSPADASAAGKRYAEQGIRTLTRKSSQRELVGTMVYIDGHDSREAALATARELESKGISDYRMINEAGKQNAISLGVFGQKQNVERARRQISELGYPVRTEPRFRQQEQYWLYFRQPASGVAPNLLTAKEIKSGARQASDDCQAMEDA